MSASFCLSKVEASAASTSQAHPGRVAAPQARLVVFRKSRRDIVMISTVEFSKRQRSVSRKLDMIAIGNRLWTEGNPKVTWRDLSRPAIVPAIRHLYGQHINPIKVRPTFPENCSAGRLRYTLRYTMQSP
jgi:hypothetical protein